LRIPRTLDQALLAHSPNPRTAEQATPHRSQFPRMIEQAMPSLSPNPRTAEQATPHRSRFRRMIEQAMPSLSRNAQTAEHRPKWCRRHRQTRRFLRLSSPANLKGFWTAATRL
jgi:hypothetical protein